MRGGGCSCVTAGSERNRVLHRPLLPNIIKDVNILLAGHSEEQEIAVFAGSRL